MEEKRSQMREGLAYGGGYFMPLSTATSKGCEGASKSVHWKPIQRQYKDLTCLILTGK